MPDAENRNSIDFSYRYTPGYAPPLYRPEADPAHLDDGVPEWICVARKLVEGNLTPVRYLEDCRAARDGLPLKYGSQIIDLSDADILVEPCDDQGFPLQLPLALVLGCVDARAPAEIVFGMEFVNDVFNVRLAGNVVAEECLGSVEYALRHLVLDEHHHEGGPSHVEKDPERRKRLRLLVALGHEGCGAVTEAVRAYQYNPGVKPIATGPVASLLGHLFFPSLIMAAEAFDAIYGPHESRNPTHFRRMCQLTAFLNAAWGAHSLQERVRAEGGKIAELVGSVYGVFDPRDMQVRALPNLSHHPVFSGSSLGKAPETLDELRELAGLLARCMKNETDADATGKLLNYRIAAAYLETTVSTAHA